MAGFGGNPATTRTPVDGTTGSNAMPVFASTEAIAASRVFDSPETREAVRDSLVAFATLSERVNKYNFATPDGTPVRPEKVTTAYLEKWITDRGLRGAFFDWLANKDKPVLLTDVNASATPSAN